MGFHVNSTIRIRGRGREEVYRSAERAISRIEKIMGRAESEDWPMTESQAAFRRFMAKLGEAIDEVGPAVEVTQNVAWVKIQSLRSGHKGKLAVGRIDSTLPPELVPGAQR